MKFETVAVGKADLLHCLLGANRHGYDTGRNVLSFREADRSTTIVYKAGDR